MSAHEALGLIVATVPLALVIHLLLVFPSGRLRARGARATVLAAYAVASSNIYGELGLRSSPDDHRRVPAVGRFLSD